MLSPYLPKPSPMPLLRPLTALLKTLIVIPTYNECDTILPLLERLLTLPSHVHVLVVDDNSPDGTAHLVCRRYQDDARVAVLHRPAKQGLGQAYVAGLSWGLQHNFDLLVQMDGDLSHDPAQLPQLLLAAHQADVVLGSRYIRGGKTPNWSRYRRLLSQAGNWHARWMLGVHIRDITGGFKCWRRASLDAIDISSIESTGYSFQVETTWRALQQGLRVVEVPITFAERRAGSSKMCHAIIWEAIRIIWRLRQIKATLVKDTVVASL